MDIPWSLATTAIAGSFHSSAILSTLFRLWYRWSKSRIWWDDVWAIVALCSDTAALISVILIGTSRPRLVVAWLTACSFPTIMWTTRISILVSMVRVSQPEGTLRRMTIGVGLMFGTMWSCVFAQRLQNCICCSCTMTRAAAIAQTARCFADLLLTTLPIILLRRVKLCRKRKILIFATFSGSTIINVVTVIQATYIFNKSPTTTSVIVAYVQTALSMIVCNLLVIVTFIYRVLHKGQMDLDAPNSTAIEFTTVDLSLEEWNAETSKGTSVPARSCSTTRSSTWSYRPIGSLASKLSSVVVGTSRVDTIQSDVIIEEERC